MEVGTAGPATVNELSITGSPQPGSTGKPADQATLMPDVEMENEPSKAPTRAGELDNSVSVEEVVVDKEPETLEDEDMESELGIGLRDVLLIVGLLLVALLVLGGLILFFKKRHVL